MPYGYNRDADTLNSIGENIGTIVGTFIKNRRLKKSRLALEREQQQKTKSLVDTKSSYLKQQLGPDDTDLYNQLTENPTPETLALAEPEILRRSKVRGDQAKADAEAQKLQDAQTKEQQTLERQTAILQKQLDMNQDMPQDVKSRVVTFLDGTKEGYEAARDEFRSWKPEKEAKQSIAEQKAAIMEDILTLGDNDLNRGLEIAKTEHPEVYRTALKFGIKPDKVEKPDDPAAPYVEQIQREFTVARKEDATLDLKKFAVDWMKAREVFIPEEVRKKILGKLYPERTSLGAEGVTEKNPDDARAEELSAKLKSDPASLSDEELDWLEQYRKSQSAAN